MMTPRPTTRPRGFEETSRRILIIVSWFLMALFVTSCSTGKSPAGASRLPRPNHVIVYDFASTPLEISPNSAFAGKLAAGAPPPTVEQLALAKQIGAKIAARLADELKAMGIPALHATVGHQPKLDDIVLRGYVVSSEGDQGRASVIGLSSASSNFGAALEGFQMTLYGLTRLGAGVTSDPVGLVFSSGAKVNALAGDGSKVDARALEIAREIAGILQKRFQEQGWTK